jgi:hypothetical protein
VKQRVEPLTPTEPAGLKRAAWIAISRLSALTVAAALLALFEASRQRRGVAPAPSRAPPIAPAMLRVVGVAAA